MEVQRESDFFPMGQGKKSGRERVSKYFCNESREKGKILEDLVRKGREKIFQTEVWNHKETST